MVIAMSLQPLALVPTRMAGRRGTPDRISSRLRVRGSELEVIRKSPGALVDVPACFGDDARPRGLLMAARLQGWFPHSRDEARDGGRFGR